MSIQENFAQDVFEDSAIADIIEDVFCAGETFKVSRPKDVDQLIEIAAKKHHFEKSRYMPYWASLWPVARKLAEHVLLMEWPHEPQRVLELGCGLGLAGLAALRRGQHVTFSDYDLAALRYARNNAELNGFHTYETLPFNWRAPLTRRFDVMIGSDLTYMPELVPYLIDVFVQMLEPHGRIIIADQNRTRPDDLQKKLSTRGLTMSHCHFDIPEQWAWNAKGSLYEIKWAHQAP